MSRTVFEVHFQHGDCDRRVSLPEGTPYLIGRSPDARFFMSHGSISRQHCRLLAEQGRVYVEDLGSRNGIYYNGLRIDRAELGARGLLQIGRVPFLMSVRSADTRSESNSALDPPRDAALKVQRGLEAEGFTVLRFLRQRPFELIAQHGPQRQVYRVVASFFPRDVFTRGLDRLRLEARQAAQLNHPTIAKALDVRSSEELLYAVFPYEEGLTLREAVSRGPLEPAKALACTRGILAALRYAEPHKAYHHFLTPDRVRLSANGQVRILGFKLGPRFQLISDASRFPPEAEGFQAPEVMLQTLEADHRADLYSTAALLAYLLTARPPFPGMSSLDTARAAMLKVPIEPHLDAVPAALRGWIRRLLSPQAAQRPATVEQAERDLDEAAMNILMPGLGPAAAPMPEPPRDVAFSGSYLTGQLLEVLALVERQRMTGTLEILDDASRERATQVVFRSGYVLDARSRMFEGREAVSKLAQMRHGTFHFEPALPERVRGRDPAQAWTISSVFGRAG